MSSDAANLVDACKPVMDGHRLQHLLGRGFLLSQAIEHWQTRAIWVVSRADADYPRRLKARLREDAPAVIYGCGNITLLDSGGLAVVGSRHVDDALVEQTMAVGNLAARAGRTIVSGGARGIDQAAIRGAWEAGGRVIGVLADSLERTAMKREHRNPMLDGQLALISPYDRNAGFNVGNAMQRNKLIYALADAALVMSCDLKKGGTWAGATEQLDKYRMIPVYVRSTDESLPGMDALLQKGAVPWPNPQDVDEFGAVNESPSPFVTASKKSLPSAPWQADPPDSDTTTINQALNPAAALFSVVREIILDLLKNPMNADEIAAALDVNKNQAQAWVKRLVEEDRVQKSGKPLRYVARQPGLFPGHLRQNNL